MSNFLRQEKRKQKAIQSESTPPNRDPDRQPHFDRNACPYCKSRSIVDGSRDTFCRNCGRHFNR